MCCFDCFKNNTNTNTNGRMNTIQITSNRSVVTREPTPYPGRHQKFIINENINVRRSCYSIMTTIKRLFLVTNRICSYGSRYLSYLNSKSVFVLLQVGVQVSNEFPDTGQTTPTTESIDFLDSTSSLGGAANMSMNFSLVLPYQQTWV